MTDEEKKDFAVEDTATNEDDSSSDLLGLGDDQIFDIRTALDGEDDALLRDHLSDLTINEKTELLQKVDAEDRLNLLKKYGNFFDADVISFLEDDIRKSVLEELGAWEVARIISDLDSDDALDLILPLETEFQHDIIRKLSSKTRIVLEEGLSFPEDSAGRLM